MALKQPSVQSMRRPSPSLDVSRRTKIVATLGPASNSPERIETLLRAGVDVVRLNFSHGTHEEHGRVISLVRQIARQIDRAVAIMQDLQGPRIRTGPLVDGKAVVLVPGQEVTVTTRPGPGDASRITTTYQGLPRDVGPGDVLLLDDGRLRLRVRSTDAEDVRAVVEVGGILGEHKGINLPGVKISAPVLTDKDRVDLAFGLANQVDYVALSFVSSAQDMTDARRWIRSQGGDVPLIAKLERAEAIAHLEDILAASNGVMVARGDLGVELGPEQVPILQKRIIRAANRRGLPVITATQMLESMTTNPLPTRAEATDVANAVWDETDALMLSAETAIGRYPVEAVQTMARLARAAEEAEQPRRRDRHPPVSRAHAISRAACSLAEDLDVTAIVGLTQTGRTAQLLSRDRPDAPIVALTPDERVYRRLTLWWGVYPLVCPMAPTSEAMFERLEQEVLRRGIARPGQTIVIVGALPLRYGARTNFVKLHTLPRRRLRGVGPET